jgi:L-amino acid N-acyltransferase YncA
MSALQGFLARDRSLPLAGVFAVSDWYALAEYHLNGWQNAHTIEQSNGGTEAVCIYQDLPWDSKLLDTPCARILYANAFSHHMISNTRAKALKQILAECIRDCDQRGIRMIDARVSTRDLFIARAFEQAGFHQVDTLVTLGGDRHTLGRMTFAPVASDVTIRSFRAEDEETLAQISYDAFGDFDAIQDRFFVEPLISHERSQELFREWFRTLARHTLEGKARIVVAEADRVPIGYVGIEPLAPFNGATWWKDSLNAVSEKSRGKGIYRALVGAAVQEALNSGVAGLFTKTQISTNRVINTWLHAGANLLESSTTLHWTHDTN